MTGEQELKIPQWRLRGVIKSTTQFIYCLLQAYSLLFLVALKGGGVPIVDVFSIFIGRGKNKQNN